MIGWRPASAKFFQELMDTDRAEARREQVAGCPRCGGPLDRADYPRKPRGLPPEWEELFSRRLSLCCRREGCRRRRTPQSVRFLGRRVYVGVVVLLAATVSVAAAIAVCGAARLTVHRWASWWSGTLPQSAFWRVARARLMPPLDDARLPSALLDRFQGDYEGALLKALRFVAPVTSPSWSSFPMGP